MTVKELKKGDFFTLKPIEYPRESQVYIRGSYDPSAKKYDCHKWNDINASRYLKGTTTVYVDFCF